MLKRHKIHGSSNDSTCSLQVGLLQVLKLSGDLLQFLQGLLMALVYQAEALREASLNAVRVRATMLAELRVVRQVRGVPVQIQELLQELREVAKIILQLVVNTTPLYNMVSGKDCNTPETHL